MARAFNSRFFSRLGLTAPAVLTGTLLLAGGCETQSFLAPQAGMGHLKPDPLTSPILDSLNVGLDESEAEYVTARDVTEEDQKLSTADYKISANDVIQVTINDLQGPGQSTVKTPRVTETGKISLDYLPQPLQAKGLTEQQLERAIVDAYREANVIQNANVSVQVVEARGRQFSAVGAVGAPGQYVIYETDFRLLDALTVAKGVSFQPGIEYLYVIRRVTPGDTDAGNSSTSNTTTSPTTAPANDPLAPQSLNSLKRTSVMLNRVAQDAATAPTDGGAAPEGGIVVVDGKPLVINPGTAATAPVIVDQPTAETITPPTTQERFEFNELKEPSDRIVIRVPYKELTKLKLRYNIVIRPGDLILVPDAQQGIYYMDGNVQSPGAFQLGGSRVTLTQAVASARGLNEVAWPSRTEIVRRLPGDRQVFVRVDLAKIYSGEQPDIYLKPDDRVNVGTNAVAPFLAAIRNGFRITYGFGFLYDRNFAPQRNNN